MKGIIMLNTITQRPGSSPDHFTLTGKNFAGRLIIRKEIPASQIPKAQRGMLYQAICSELSELIEMSTEKPIIKNKIENSILKLQDYPAFSLCKAVIEVMAPRMMDIAPSHSLLAYALFESRLARVIKSCQKSIIALAHQEMETPLI